MGEQRLASALVGERRAFSRPRLHHRSNRCYWKRTWTFWLVLGPSFVLTHMRFKAAPSPVQLPPPWNATGDSAHLLWVLFPLMNSGGLREGDGQRARQPVSAWVEPLWTPILPTVPQPALSSHNRENIQTALFRWLHACRTKLISQACIFPGQWMHHHSDSQTLNAAWVFFLLNDWWLP